MGKDEGIVRVTWHMRNLPLEIYDYAAASARRHTTITTIGNQLLDMVERGFHERQREDRAEHLLRLADLERRNREKELRTRTKVESQAPQPGNEQQPAGGDS